MKPSLCILIAIFLSGCVPDPELGDRYVADKTTTTVINNKVSGAQTVRWNSTVDENCYPNQSVPMDPISIMFVNTKPSISPGDLLEFVVRYENIELPSQNAETPCFLGFANERHQTVVSDADVLEVRAQPVN